MKPNHVELLRRLEQFQLDSPEAALPFSARLARENQWPTAHARRVITEYKRFAFLAVAAGHPMSPSEDVDQVWHLHLTYSQNYWKVFCPEILGHPLHHQPTQGGGDEREKFADWYRQTLLSYRAFFGEEPPHDIWPTPAEREREKCHFVRVDRERNWVIRKPQRHFVPKLAALTSLALITMVGTGAMLAQGANPFDWRGPDFLWFYAGLFAACFATSLWLRRKLRLPVEEPARTDVELGGYEIACLNGGKVLAVNTAIANLVNRNLMRVDGKQKLLIARDGELTDSHELEHTVHEAAQVGAKIGEVRESTKPVIERILEDLKARGLVVPDSQARKAVVFPLLVALAPVAAGIVKICLGVSRGKPVGFLIAFCAVSLVVSLMVFARRPLRSRHGDAVLRQLKERHAGSRRLGRSMRGLSAAEFAAVVGLFGMTALAGTELDSLRKSLQPPGGGSSCGSSCGSGCGGGGGGGGCGGCGGGD